MICEKCSTSYEGNFCPNCGYQNVCVVENVEEQAKKKKGNVCSLLGVIFGAISIVPVLNLIFLLPAIILTIVGIVKSKDRKKGIMVASIILVVVALISFVLWVGTSDSEGTDPSDNVTNTINTKEKCDESAKEYAIESVRKILKNPESLQVHSTDIQLSFANDEFYYYKIIVDYSAQNGFGGYNRKTDYEVRVKVRKSTQRAVDVSIEEYTEELQKYNASH